MLSLSVRYRRLTLSLVQICRLSNMASPRDEDSKERHGYKLPGPPLHDAYAGSCVALESAPSTEFPVEGMRRDFAKTFIEGKSALPV